jgi:hypothetical protein
MKTKLLIAVLAGFTFTACTNPTPPAPVQKTMVNSYENASETKIAAYNKDMRTVGLSTRKDPKYKSFGFKTTEEKDWFRDLTYAYWNRDITKSQFISRGLTKYPDQRYEFTFVADGFQKV